jgi:sugar phosphate permease
MDDSIKKKYNYWQWRTLIILMLGYALFYIVRKNFSITMPALESELGISKVQLGLFLTLNGIIYGVSRFINGFLVDRIKAKRILMATGLALSAVVTILIGLSPQMNGLFHFLDDSGKATVGLVYYIGTLWLINGYLQGMGYPPCCTLMAHWIKPSELATKQAIWNTSHSIGAGLAALICGTLILGGLGYSAWQMCFFIPGILAFAGAFLLLLGLKDNPSDVGLPDPETLDDNKTEVAKDDPAEAKRKYKLLIGRMVFKNPIIWILAIANFFTYIIRFTILDWGSMILTQFKGMSIETAGVAIASTEIVGGILGTLFGGWITDKVFKSKAQVTSCIGLFCATICMLIFWRLPKSANTAALIAIIMASFFIYMPQALLGIAASNQATKTVAASANGILGILGYLSTTVSGVLFGFLADKYGWNSVFVVAICMGIFGTLILATLLHKPADGYAKANAILNNHKQ